MTVEQMQAEMDKLRAENARLASNQKPVGKGPFSVTKKGAIHIRGIGSFGLTLYRDQIVRFFTEICEVPVPAKLDVFIKANLASLTEKPEGYVSLRQQANDKKISLLQLVGTK